VRTARRQELRPSDVRLGMESLSLASMRESIQLDDRDRGSRYGRILKLPPSIGRTTPKRLRSSVTTVRVS